MASQTTLFIHWRHSLEHFIVWFENLRKTTRFFYPKAFMAFMLLNLACFWLALITAFPHLLFGEKAIEYSLMSFPVAFLGAVFDILSLFVTLFIIHRALNAKSNISYIGYLSIDIVIAVLATFWVLFVFMISGWVVSYILAQPETIGYRQELYQGRVNNVIHNPLARESIKHVYFGVIMGGSALLPTLIHILMALKAFFSSVFSFFGSAAGDAK